MKKLVLLLAMMCFSPAVFAENMLVNGDWETGTIDGWGPRFGGGQVSAVTENPTPHGGTYCGKQVNRTQTWHGIIQTQNMLDVLVRGETYPYSAWVRTDAASPVNVALTMQSNPGGNARYSNIDNAQADNTGWFLMEGEYTFPTEVDDNGTTFTFYFEVTGSATAQLYIDDAVLGTVGPINAPYDPFVEPYIEAGETCGTPFTTDDVNYSINDIILNFKAGLNPATEEGIDPAIVKHYVYLSVDSPSDPNVYQIATLQQTSTTDPNQRVVLADLANPIVLAPGTTYYWQVKQILKGINGVTFVDDDPNNILGEVWEFMTTSPVPTIFSITDHMLMDENGAASYTIDVSPTGNFFEWYKVVGAVDSAENGETNDVKLSDNAMYSGTTTKTLSITGAASDGSADAQYYALAYNGDPSLVTSSVSAPSAARWLWAPNLMSHFEFETLAEGVTSDGIGGFSATVNSIVAEGETAVTVPALVAGTPEIGGNALSFGGNTGTSAVTGNFMTLTPGVTDYKDITISAWVIWNGGNAWQRIIDCGLDTNNYVFLSPGNAANGGNLAFAVKRNGDEDSITTTALPIGEWAYVTATLTGDTARLYVNGTFRSKGTIAHNPIDAKGPNNYLGDSQWAGDPFFNGVIDDLKIYNYARTTEQVAKDYLVFKGEYICDMENNDMEFDFDDNCQIDILDFASFAATWMDSYRIYPDQE